MVGTSNARPTVGVSDLAKAKDFYGGVLGLELAKDSPYVLIYMSGNGELEVYKTDFAGTNKATYVTWEVADIDSEIVALKGKGVVFEHYDGMPGVTREGEVHTMGDEKAAWFKDPDGNILCVHE